MNDSEKTQPGGFLSYFRSLDIPDTYQFHYGGYCADCGEAHSLPSDHAIPHALKLMQELELHKCLDFDLPEKQRDPELSTDWLYSDMRGKMFGVLVCEDEAGNEIVLKAFSSKYNGFRSVPSWVPPVVDEARFDAEIEAGNQVIHPLTERIEQLKKGTPEYDALVSERKAVSRPVLEKLLALYTFRNFRNETRSLQQAFLSGKRIAIGTGDCCAPKLVSYAAKNNLRPKSIAEFFWGKETVSGDRQQGQFYGACTERCQPLLGYLLCGLD
jgi:hypothetical protein